MSEENNTIDPAILEKIAGGMGGEIHCTYCNSTNVSFRYEHDDICLFNCNSCGKGFEIRY